MAFKTLDGGGFLEFSVSIAKYLAFDTLDENTLITSINFFHKCSIINVMLVSFL